MTYIRCFEESLYELRQLSKSIWRLVAILDEAKKNVTFMMRVLHEFCSQI